MRRSTTFILAALATSIFAMAAGCDDSSDGDATATDKPLTDPDSDADPGKADAISNLFTTFLGPLDDAGQDGTIDFPHFFHGYSVELTAGQTFAFGVLATEDGPVRLYGPAVRWRDGRPYFGRAVAAPELAADGQDFLVDFRHEVELSGTYMILYGPSVEWKADYIITADCVAGCKPEGVCDSDVDCAEDEFCGHNGVNCVAAPCDVSFNVCQAKGDAGAGCSDAGDCGPGLVCASGACSTDTPGCTDNDDCDSDSWCSCADDACASNACKPFAGEGARCGGFVLPSYRERCADGSQCLINSSVPDLPGNCGQPATIADILADPSAYDGRYVGVLGHIGVGPALCTRAACGPSNPCCNTCGAAQKLADDEADLVDPEKGIELSGINGEGYGCSGNNCDWAEHCSLNDGGYWVTGRVSVGQYGNVTLTTERLSPVSFSTP